MNNVHACGGRRRFWQRGIALCLVLTMAVAGCARPPNRQQPERRTPPSITLLGIAVDGARAAGADEPGLVRIWRDGQAIEGRIGMLLAHGDFVETGRRADALIRFPNGSLLYMRADSRGRIGSLSEAVGEFFAKIKGVFSIESSFVRAAANGTAFHVRAQTDGAMSVTVHEGQVFVDSTRGSWARIALGPGTMLSAHERASAPMQASETEMRYTQQWVDNLDQVLAQPRAASGGSVAGAVAIGVAIAGAAALLSSRKDDKPPRDGPYSTRPTPDAPALTAPTARGPGSADAASPAALTCTRGGITLSWGGVPGARDYLVTLQSRTTPRSPWATVASQATIDPRADVVAERGGRYRWWVQARDGRSGGPGSSMLYFDCPSSPR